jgi:uncharacterized tellurite resistance protein B-like protein
MYNKIQDLIYKTTGIDLGVDEPEADINARIAVASLLFVTASSDGSVDSQEVTKMVQALCERYSINTMAALDLINQAEGNLTLHGGSLKLLAELNARLSHKQKEDLILMLLDVIAADGEKEATELAMLDRTVVSLGISDKQVAKIYERYFARRRP